MVPFGTFCFVEKQGHIRLPMNVTVMNTDAHRCVKSGRTCHRQCCMPVTDNSFSCRTPVCGWVASNPGPHLQNVRWGSTSTETPRCRQAWACFEPYTEGRTPVGSLNESGRLVEPPFSKMGGSKSSLWRNVWEGNDLMCVLSLHKAPALSSHLIPAHSVLYTWANHSAKGQLISIVGFAGHVAYVATTWCCCVAEQPQMTQTNGCGHIPVESDLQNQVLGWIGCVGCSSLTPGLFPGNASIPPHLSVQWN